MIESLNTRGWKVSRKNGERNEMNAPLITERTSLPLATSMHVLPLLSRRVSSIPSCSRSEFTTSARPSEAAKWRAVVPDAGG